MNRKTGHVKFFNQERGFGFVEVDDVDYFVHVTNINEADELLDGEEVSFRPAKGKKGWQALEVDRIDPPVLERERGTISRFDTDRGFGFIERDGKADVFAHVSDVECPEDAIEVGSTVEFDVREGREGRERAYRIELVEV